ncbi:hypothetical protein O59_002494 [Cellvibrio sp. BR]|nr:hypothetical protein O59_002494 [Cellvibrio sp. BR]
MIYLEKNPTIKKRLFLKAGKAKKRRKGEYCIERGANSIAKQGIVLGWFDRMER